MKKLWIALAILAGVIIALFFTGLLTGALRRYNNPTPANEPALKTGSSFVASNLKTPVRGNFIVYESSSADSMAPATETGKIPARTYVKRLCGVPGDILEMKNGILFVNGMNFDADLLLKSFYKTSFRALSASGMDMDSLQNGEPQDFRQADTDKLMINLDDHQAAALKKQISIARYIQTDTGVVFKWMNNHTGYTVDNWGPIIIPEGRYFVLGDNRQNSLDSRYFGFVKKRDCKGVVIWK